MKKERGVGRGSWVGGQFNFVLFTIIILQHSTRYHQMLELGDRVFGARKNVTRRSGIIRKGYVQVLVYFGQLDPKIFLLWLIRLICGKMYSNFRYFPTYAYLCTLMHTQRCLTHHLCFLSWNLTRYMQQVATTTLEMSSQCLSNNFCTTKQANHSLRASPITSTCSFCFCLCTGKS